MRCRSSSERRESARPILPSAKALVLFVDAVGIAEFGQRG